MYYWISFEFYMKFIIIFVIEWYVNSNKMLQHLYDKQLTNKKLIYFAIICLFDPDDINFHSY